MAADDRNDAGAPAGIAVASAATPYALALADAAFRARLERLYAGEHALLDALWWLEHPREPGPSGATPPAVLLGEARRVLYSRSAAPDAVGLYTAAAAAERADRDTLVAALRERSQPPAMMPLPLTSVAPRPVVLPATGAAHRGRRLLGMGLTAGLAVVALLGWGRGTTQAAPARDPVLMVEAQTLALDGLRTFTPALEPRVLVHRLAVVGGTTVVAKLTRGLVCIELRARGGASSACRSLGAFRKEGLHVPFPTGSSEVGDLRWSSDGRLRLSLAR